MTPKEILKACIAQCDNQMLANFVENHREDREFLLLQRWQIPDEPDVKTTLEVIDHLSEDDVFDFATYAALYVKGMTDIA